MTEQRSKVQQRALRLAGNALRAAYADNLPLANTIIERIDAECGVEGVTLAILGWSDTLIKRTPHLTGKPVRLAFMNADSGRVDENADDVPQEVRWAGRLIAARAADDEQTWNALIDALPRDEAAVGRHVGHLLQMVALNLRHLDQAKKRGAR